MANEKTIVLKGEHNVRNEANAAVGGAIVPGNLLQWDAAGTVSNHGTVGGNAAPIFAVENDILGREIGVAYTAGEVVQFDSMRTGTWVNAFLAIGENVSIGDALESAGDGSLRAHTPLIEDSAGEVTGGGGTTIYTDAIVGYAREAVNNVGGSDEARIAVEIA